MPRSGRLDQVLRSAARLQELVPDAVLVGGTAAALHAGHRESYDHDHVLVDLDQRYAQVLEAVETSEGGLRNLRRIRPLETVRVEVAADQFVTVPTAAEALRVKAYLVVQRNQVRDYLDVVALAEHMGLDESVRVLSDIDAFYEDRSEQTGSVLTQLVLRLADPAPFDVSVTKELPRYKHLDPRWHAWADVVSASQTLAVRLSGAG